MKTRQGMCTFAFCGVIALGATFAGCGSSGGGGGGGGGGFVSPAPGVDAPGPLQAGLPAVQRGSYSFQTTQLNQIQGSGVVTGLAGIADTATDVVVFHAPLNQAVRISDGLLSVEDSFPARVQSVAQIGSVILAATSDPSRPQLGRVFRRESFGSGFANWQDALSTQDNEVYISSVNSAVYAMSGSEGGSGTIYQLAATAPTGSFSTLATIDDQIPLVVADYNGQVYLGSMDSTLGGGAARLNRLLGSSFQDVPLPSQGGGGGIRQEVTDMLVVGSVGSGTTGGVLVIAVGAFNRSTGIPVSGYIAVTDGTEFETMEIFTQDAPTSLAWMDQTIYVGTGAGRLLYRALDGSWIEESALPVNQGIYSLLVRDTDTLMMGARGTEGALLITRYGGNAAPAPTPTPTGRYYTPDVKQVLQLRCISCHTNDAIVLDGQMLLSVGLVDDAADIAKVLMRVDLAAPDMSTLLLKSTNQVVHTGAGPISVGSAEYNILLEWIQGGAPLQQ